MTSPTKWSKQFEDRAKKSVKSRFFRFKEIISGNSGTVAELFLEAFRGRAFWDLLHPILEQFRIGVGL
jgi:hypothetical protein